MYNVKNRRSMSCFYDFEKRKKIYPAGNSCVANVWSAGAPPEAGQQDDEGDDVEGGGHTRVHNLHPQERERQLDLNANVAGKNCISSSS